MTALLCHITMEDPSTILVIFEAINCLIQKYIRMSGRRLEWTTVKTDKNTHGENNFSEIKINVSIPFNILTKRTIHVVHYPKPII